jgi:exodeoxyribonuclease VII small subunit
MGSPKNKPDEKTSVEDLTYEQAFEELELMVNALESEDHPLDDALALFERGQALARHCASLLDKAELTVQQLSGNGLIDFEQESEQ